MYLRKHAAIGISLIMAMASISGCGGAKGGNGAPQNKETQGKETQDKGAQDKGARTRRPRVKMIRRGRPQPRRSRGKAR